jgi:hypothetical protein
MGGPKRHIQPERYAPLIPDISEKIVAAASVPPQIGVDKLINVV